MPFFLDGNPTSGEISEAINYLLGNAQQTTSTNTVNGQVTDSTGAVVSYLYKYLYVKYADSFDGTVNFSNTPTSRLYYGLRNNDSPTESTNPADYIWYKVAGGFGTTKFVFYSVTGGRRINIVVGLSAPSILYQADSGAAINLDQISGSDGASSRICYAKSTSFALASTPATYQTSGPSSFPPTNTWGGAETWQATPPTLATNEALFQSDGIYNPTSDLTTWNVPYLSNLKVGALSAISANLGTVTAGELIVTSPSSSTPVISGTTMAGSGTHLYNDGRFALGNSGGNIVFNGTNVYINGFLNSSSTTSFNTNLTNSQTTALSFTVNKAGDILITTSNTLSAKTGYLANSVSGIIASVQYVVQDAVHLNNYASASTDVGGGVVNNGGYRYVYGATSFNTVVHLLPGNYEIRVTGNATAFDSSGNVVSGGISLVNLYGTFNAFQVLA